MSEELKCSFCGGGHIANRASEACALFLKLEYNKILEIIRNHYYTHYTAYDTYIDNDNLIEHLLEILKDHIENRTLLESINRITSP